MRRGAPTEVALVAVVGAPPAVGRVGGPYRVSDEDPLALLVAGWVARWSQGDEVAFETAALTVLERKPELPDYYLVAGAQQADGGPFAEPVLRRHFYLGFLHGLRPGRVGPGDDVINGIRGLGNAPWWPDLDEMVTSARGFRADAIG